MNLIEIDDDGRLRFSATSLGRPQRPTDYVLQVFMVMLVMTPGTNIEFPTMGGGVFALLSKARRPVAELRVTIAEAVSNISAALTGMVPKGNTDYTVSSITLRNVERSQDGRLMIYVDFKFENARPFEGAIPMNDL